MPSVGYSTTIKAGGPSTAMVAEACAGSGTAWQVTNTARRIIDPAVAVTVKDNGVAVAADLYTVDYLFGNITFTASKVGPITIDGNYLTPVDVAEAKEATFKLEREMLDGTSFSASSDGYMRKTPGMFSASGSLTTLKPLQADLDAGAGTTILSTLLTSGTQFILEIRPGGAGNYFRAWVLIEGADQKIAPGALYEGTVSWVSAPVLGNGQTESALFGFSQ